MSIAGKTRKWTEFAKEELEFQYNPRASNPDPASYDEARSAVNADGLRWPGRVADIAYGDGHLMDLDIYKPIDGNAPFPVHLYIHGGYWRAREKENFGFIGASLAAQGVLTVVINYPLCPVVTLDEVVEANRAAFAWIVKYIDQYGGDPGRLTLSGHSAGAHLGAAIIAADWSSHDLGDLPLKGAILISGIYDPAPTQYISVNAEIGITPELAHRHAYINHPPKLRCPVHVIVGSQEPEGWIAQSADYANHLEAAGYDVSYFECEGGNHFSLLDQYRDPSSAILSAILKDAGV
jgi:arylformamidase